MFFKDIIGNEKNQNALKTVIKNGKISHAYIMSGIDGVGKTTVAKAFSMGIMCENFTDDSCGECKSCHLIKSNSHPDIKVLDLTVDEDGTKKATIGVEAIRSLKKDVYLKPFYGKRKIYILENAELMTVEAQNSLLKVFDEPPEYAVIILVCSNINKILSTIISRAVNLRFDALKPAEILQFTEKNYSDFNNKKVISEICGGSIKKAVELIEDEAGLELRSKVLKAFFYLLLAESDTAINELAEILVQNKSINAEIISMLSNYLSDLAKVKSGHKELIMNLDFLNEIIRNSESMDINSIYEMQNELAEFNEYILRNANYKLVVIDKLIALHELSKKKR